MLDTIAATEYANRAADEYIAIYQERHPEQFTSNHPVVTARYTENPRRHPKWTEIWNSAYETYLKI